MNSIKPSLVLFFTLICLGCLGVIMLLFPKDGVTIGGVHLKFITARHLFMADTVKYANVDDVIAQKQDSTILKELNSLEDSLKAFKTFALDNPRRIFYAKDDHSVLFPLFKALEEVQKGGEGIHILHYGDSQIEIDRITGYIREQLQQKFGGSGPGLQPPLQVIPATHISQSSSGSFVRYAAWGFDSTVKRASHGRYGIMYNFCELPSGGTVSFSPASKAYPKAKEIQRVRVLYGDAESDLTVKLSAGGRSYPARTGTPGKKLGVLEWKLDTTVSSLSVTFSGGGNPEIYGIALDGLNGVSVDNMPMRGCSGTIFTKADTALLRRSLEAMNVKLIIFQFGGNMMPSISGPKGAQDYGKRFYDNLMYIKQIRPDISILTIGLADMSKKIDGKMQSYPYIVEVRNALRQATFDAGGAYWDMFEAMGGLNSMPGWVDRKPALAGKDYIHFTTAGAQQIAEWFYESLMNDYQVYCLQKRIDEVNARKEKKGEKP